MCCNKFAVSILISIWTIVQSSFHLVWTLQGYFLHNCSKFYSGYYVLVFMYLTYFYRHECGDIELHKGSKFLFSSSLENETDTNTDNFYEILYDVINKGILPEHSNAAYRTYMYILGYIVCDSVWIISSIILLIGTCFQPRKKWSLIIYGPWLTSTIAIIFLDTVSAVHFGLDLRYTNNIVNWLDFIGIKNYKEFEYLDKNKSLSWIITMLPSLIMTFLFSRFTIFWVLNIVEFFIILDKCMTAYQGSNRANRSKGNSTNLSDLPGIDLTTTSARIRNWQLFYGAAESTNSISGSTEERDFNSNSRSKSPSKHIAFASRINSNLTENEGSRPRGRPQPIVFQTSSQSRTRRPSDFSPSDLDVTSHGFYYTGYKDPADDLDKISSNKQIVQSHLPWSYFPRPELKSPTLSHVHKFSLPPGRETCTEF